MPKLRVHAFGISLDGYGAGPNQDLENPLGKGGLALHEWVFATRTFQKMHAGEGGIDGVDDDFAARASPILERGSWAAICSGPSGDPGPTTNGEAGGVTIRRTIRPHLCSRGMPEHRSSWKEERPFISSPMAYTPRSNVRWRQPTAGMVRLGGGVATIRQYLQAGLVDEMHVAISPVLLGSGEHLFVDLDLPASGYQSREHVTTPNLMRVVLAKSQRDKGSD